MRRALLIIPPAFLLLAQCGSAVAATVQLNEQTGDLIYRAARGERNDLRIRASEGVSRDNESSSFFLEDSVPMTAGGACSARGGEPSSYFVRCELDWTGVRIRVILRDRSDRVRFSGNFAAEAAVMGGPGNDRLTGTEGRNRLAGGPGRDVIFGLGGSDTIFAGTLGNDRGNTSDRLYGGAGSDAIQGSRGDNLLDGGPAADLVYAKGGRDRVRVRDGAVDQVICGRGTDATRNDPFDFLIRCERHEPFSDSPAVPLELNVSQNPGSATVAYVLVGCLERRPARACAGTVQLEEGGEADSAEVAFTGLSGHRQLVTVSMDSSGELNQGLGPGVRIRSQSSAGSPTDEVFPATSLLVGFPFLN